jgi:hypothetical protein
VVTGGRRRDRRFELTVDRCLLVQAQWSTDESWGTVFRPFLVDFKSAGAWIFLLTIFFFFCIVSVLGTPRLHPFLVVVAGSRRSTVERVLFWMGQLTSLLEGARPRQLVFVRAAATLWATHHLTVLSGVMSGIAFLPVMYLLLDPWICMFSNNPGAGVRRACVHCGEWSAWLYRLRSLPVDAECCEALRNQRLQLLVGVLHESPPRGAGILHPVHAGAVCACDGRGSQASWLGTAALHSHRVVWMHVVIAIPALASESCAVVAVPQTDQLWFGIPHLTLGTLTLRGVLAWSAKILRYFSPCASMFTSLLANGLITFLLALALDSRYVHCAQRQRC